MVEASFRLLDSEDEFLLFSALRKDQKIIIYPDTYRISTRKYTIQREWLTPNGSQPYDVITSQARTILHPGCEGARWFDHAQEELREENALTLLEITKLTSGKPLITVYPVIEQAETIARKLFYFMQGKMKTSMPEKDPVSGIKYLPLIEGVLDYVGTRKASKIVEQVLKVMNETSKAVAF